MGTKILYYDPDGDLSFSIAVYASLYEDEEHGRGVFIGTADDDSLFIRNEGYPEDIIKELYRNDRVDLTPYGNMTYLDD